MNYMNIIHRFSPKDFFLKPRTILSIAIILFLPLLFLGTNTSHDWGDDFAQYIHQSKNIVQGISQSETGYVYNQLNYIGPQAYPIGFPLLLAPVYALAGNNILAHITYISIIYIILGLLLIAFFKHYFSWISALVLAILFLYNPQMIIFKREVMSDIPFTALLVLCFILYNKYKSGNWKQHGLLAFIIGFMLIVRPAGVVFVAAIIMEQLVSLFRKQITSNDFIIRSSVFTIVPVFFYFLVNSVLFAVPSAGSVQNYLAFFTSGNMLQVIPQNFLHHIEVFRYLNIPQAGPFQGISLLIGSAILTFTALGFLKRIMQSPEIIDWFFIFYTVMLLVFPNNASAFRSMPLLFLQSLAHWLYIATAKVWLILLQQILR